jgi:hypothetical protein
VSVVGAAVRIVYPEHCMRPLHYVHNHVYLLSTPSFHARAHGLPVVHVNVSTFLCTSCAPPRHALPYLA